MSGVPDCPECRQGRHPNCTVTVLTYDGKWAACPCAERGHGPVTGPALTYAGTSGHSGTDTSQERAEREDSDGTPLSTQERVLSDTLWTGTHGITVKELRQRYPWLHHGKISSALTNLHRAGGLARLSEQRDGCKIYVVPSYARGRVTEKYLTREERRAQVIISEDERTIAYKGKLYRRASE